MPVIQKDIAERLGIDRTLVAHALRGDPRVAAATRRKVQEVAQELGYNSYSNLDARSLGARRFGRRAETGVIAVVTGHHFEDVPIPDVPFIRDLMQGIEREAINNELDVFWCSTVHRRLPRFITEPIVDGVICLHVWDDIRSLPEKISRPILRVGDFEPGDWSLTVTDFEGMRSVTNHVISQAHSRIAYLGDVREGCPDCSARDKFHGFQAALQEAGLPAHPELIDTVLQEPTEARGREAMLRLLARTRDFTALVCHNDSIAMGAIRVAADHGINVPRDLSVVGFDDVSESYGFEPGLTSVSFDRVAMGQRAVQMLRESSAANSAAERTSECIPTKLVVRESTRVL